MKKRVRQIIFFGFLFLFIVLSPLAILYSQGYRLDIENKKITQTGGLFLRIRPKRAEIYINGRFIKKTDLFFGSALIENLLPAKYRIEVRKEGYFPWKKSLPVRERDVTEAKDIVLFPKNINFSILSRGVEKFWISPHGKKLILKEDEGNGQWELALYDLEKGVKSRLITEGDIYQKGADLMALDFEKNPEIIDLDVGLREQEKKFRFDIKNPLPTLKEEKTSTSSLAGNALSSEDLDGNHYFTDGFGNLFKNGEKLSKKAFPLKKETKYSLKIFGNLVFLEEGNNLYLFNPDSGSFEPFFDGVKGLKISPDGKKLAYFSTSEIWVFFLGKKKKILLTRLFSEKIKNIFWFDPNYIIFTAGDKIKISETDNRDGLNIVEVPSPFNSPEVYFNRVDNKFYVLSGGRLFQSSALPSSY